MSLTRVFQILFSGGGGGGGGGGVCVCLCVGGGGGYFPVERNAKFCWKFWGNFIYILVGI